MEEKDKQLLLKDLCARLPYGVICHYNCVIPIEGSELHKANCKDILRGIVPAPDEHVGFMVGFDKVNALEGDIKPYLRPMSSMTEEEVKEIQKINWQFCKPENCLIECFVGDADDGYCSVSQMARIINYLNAHHFDYLGLIPMGLALEAPNDMYKTE